MPVFDERLAIVVEHWKEPGHQGAAKKAMDEFLARRTRR